MATPLNFQSPLARRFMGTVQSGGLTNPYGLAAVYSTGKHESAWSPKNVYGEWGDPSESGKPGRAGGALSWRAERLDNLRSFAKSRGDDPRRPSVETQAEFFLSEDPTLIEALQGANNPREAQRAMDKAWRFAGYDRPGGEAARRLRTTQETLGEILGGEAGARPMVGSAGTDQVEDDMATGGQQGMFSGLIPTLKPMVKSPENRSELLAMVLKNMQDDAKRPNPQSWGETALRVLGDGLKTYRAHSLMSKNEADDEKRLNALADILQGTNPQAAEAMRSGVLGGSDDWKSAVIESMFKEPEKPEAFTLSPGQARFHGDQEIASIPDRPEKPSDRELRVQMMVDNGTPPEIATGIATGQFVVRTSPYTQQPEVVNLADGKVVFDGNTQTAPAASQGDSGAPVPDTAAPAAEQGRPSYIPENVDPTDATGASGFFGGLVNQVSDLFGQGVPFPEIEEAAEALNTTQILTMSLLQAEIPGRPSQFLLQKLEKLTVDPKSLARADERSITRLKQTRDLIKNEVDRVERDILARPQDFRPADMTKARLNASQLKGLLKAYDAMLGTVTTRREESKPGLEQFDKRRR